MRYFDYYDGQLHAEQCALAAIAERYDTPTYIYSRAAITKQVRAYQQALVGQPHLLCYAVKANSNLAVLNLLARLDAGFDIVSVGELERVLAAGGDPAKVVFSGVAKTPAEMRRALEVGIHCFNIESTVELETLNRIAAEQQVTAPISIRVNPNVDVNTHPYIATGLRENKFGIAIEQALAVYQYARTLPAIDILGVDCHIGSQLTTLTPLVDAMDSMLQLVDQLAAAGIAIRHLDIGGGLGVRYRDEQPPSIADYVHALRERLGERKLTLVFEPGRSIVANAGILLTRVVYLKSNQQRHFAIVDAAMNDMLRPALYQAWLAVDPVQPRTTGQLATYDLVGPVCESGDFIAKQRELMIEPGDLLSVASCGAYGFSMSSNYNSRPRPAEVMVDGDTIHLIRRRETMSDLMRGESILPIG
jgi:diaminopimelate decarboxylase